MARQLVVESETLAVCADLSYTGDAGNVIVYGRIGGGRNLQGRIHRRLRRVQREQVLQVRQQQFLVLLFVIDAEDDALPDVAVVPAREQLLHRLVDVPAIGENFAYRRPCQHAPVGAFVHLADRVIIRVEDIVKVVVETTVAGGELLEQEALEKPGDVRKMPFGRTRIRHRLHDEILRQQVLAQREGGRARAEIFRRQRRKGTACRQGFL